MSTGYVTASTENPVKVLVKAETRAEIFGLQAAAEVTPVRMGPSPGSLSVQGDSLGEQWPHQAVPQSDLKGSAVMVTQPDVFPSVGL